MLQSQLEYAHWGVDWNKYERERRKVFSGIDVCCRGTSEKGRSSL